MTTDTQPMTGDELIDWLATNLDQFNADETITPFTLTAIHPGVPFTRAENALHDLHACGLLYKTSRSSVYALRPDLPTSGNGHVWLRVANRAGAPVEVIGKRPRPADSSDVYDQFVHWTCHGCAKGHVSSLFINADTRAREHADQCGGQFLAR